MLDECAVRRFGLVLGWRMAGTQLRHVEGSRSPGTTSPGSQRGLAGSFCPRGTPRAERSGRMPVPELRDVSRSRLRFSTLGKTARSGRPGTGVLDRSTTPTTCPAPFTIALRARKKPQVIERGLPLPQHSGEQIAGAGRPVPGQTGELISEGAPTLPTRRGRAPTGRLARRGRRRAPAGWPAVVAGGGEQGGDGDYRDSGDDQHDVRAGGHGGLHSLLANEWQPSPPWPGCGLRGPACHRRPHRPGWHATSTASSTAYRGRRHPWCGPSWSDG
jgi:hypothetical protein